MNPQDLDRALMTRIQRGDERALSALYDRFTHVLYPMALRIVGVPEEAEDVVQESWVQVWKRAPSYDPARGSVQAWLLTIVRSRALDRYRSVRARRRVEDHLVTEAKRGGVPVSHCATTREFENRDHVEDALNTLRPEQREILEIAYFEGLSQTEIAERLETPLGTVKSWMRRGLMTLRDAMSREASSGRRT